jgi:soluble lytic murein transglycosylase-like protein
MDRSTNYRRAPGTLFDPNLNMRLGQDYLHWLMDQFHNDGDLGRLFASYNGGPGWLSRWLATQSADIDPLMVLETMPREASRDYAERVLSHMALCRKRYGQPTPELDALASGRPALYTPLDHASAANGRSGAN